MATDADWGRIYQFNTTGDSGLIMPFRSYYFRDFFVGSWLDMSIGLVYANCGNTGDYSVLVDERQKEITPENLFHFGLSQSNSGVIDVANNPVFLGLRGIMGGVTQIMGSAKQLSYVLNTLVNQGTTQLSGNAQTLNLQAGTDDTTFQMIGLRFTFNPQTNELYVNFAQQSNVTLTADAQDYPILQPFLEGISNLQSTADVVFNLPSTSNFSSYYIYWPYLTNKLKLHCIGAIKMG